MENSYRAKCYTIIEEQYNQKPEEWRDYYSGVMENLQEYYEKIGDKTKADEFREKLERVKS